MHQEQPVTPDAILDTTGLRCPLPVLKLRKAMRNLPPGGRLLMLATDPGARADVADFCAASGNRLLDADERGETLRFVIEKPLDHAGKSAS
jgi:tRNA 2-thiouridine synthesizing protein A